VLLLCVSGCASAAAAVNTTRAVAAIESARESGAGKAHPYEMTLAEAYLAKAREESSEAQYLDAIHYAQSAKSFAERATLLARERSLGTHDRIAVPNRGVETRRRGEGQ
jgi:hypothetical protein